MFMKLGSTSNGAVAPWALLPKSLAIVALLHSGAMFGFFYAWVCSTMWGLDAADPNVAISAMQAMNASVRNPVFAQTFFGAALLLLAAALAAWDGKERRAALFFGSGGLVYVLGAMVPTMAASVPLNETLAMVETPVGNARAQVVWRDYSVPWQLWNALRAVAAGIALLLAGLGVLSLGRLARRCCPTPEPLRS